MSQGKSGIVIGDFRFAAFKKNLTAGEFVNYRLAIYF